MYVTPPKAVRTRRFKTISNMRKNEKKSIVYLLLVAVLAFYAVKLLLSDDFYHYISREANAQSMESHSTNIGRNNQEGLRYEVASPESTVMTSYDQQQLADTPDTQQEPHDEDTHQEPHDEDTQREPHDEDIQQEPNDEDTQQELHEEETQQEPTIDINKIQIVAEKRLAPETPYLINPAIEICGNKDLDIIVYVRNRANDHKRRMLIRNTWAQLHVYTDVTVRVLFLIGIEPEVSEHDGILEEAASFRDIIQVNVVESVSNITSKHLLGLQWHTYFCAHVPLIVESEDDVFVNVFKLVQFYKQLRTRNRLRRLLYCQVRVGDKTIRDKHSKWYISKKQYKSSQLPNFCSPFAHALTSDVAVKLYRASLTADVRIPIDSIYITGTLARKARVVHTSLDKKHGYGAVLRKRYTDIGDSMFCLFQKKNNDYLRSEWPKYWNMLLEKYYVESMVFLVDKKGRGSK